jgi:hypothetical protein
MKVSSDQNTVLAVDLVIQVSLEKPLYFRAAHDHG